MNSMMPRKNVKNLQKNVREIIKNTLSENSPEPADSEENEIAEINSQREENGLPEITYDDCQWEYEEYHETVSKKVTDAIETKLKEIIKGYIAIEYQKLVSPREYNFANDSLNIKVLVDDAAFDSIFHTLQDNMEEFKDYIKNRYTRCSVNEFSFV